MVVSVVAFLVAIYFMIVLGFAMTSYTYGYNLTKEDIVEGNMLQLCVTAAWYIEDCWDMYGGINTKYGEPLK